MKLIFAVIRDKDANGAIDSLSQSHLGVTKLSSTGGFLRDGNTTLMIGVEDGQVQRVLDILRQNCSKRSQTDIMMPHSGSIPTWSLGPPSVTVEVGGAIVFVLDVEQFHKL